MRRDPNKDCPNCFVKDCDCKCNTCKSNHERNESLSNTELVKLNLADAIKVDEESKDAKL